MKTGRGLITWHCISTSVGAGQWQHCTPVLVCALSCLARVTVIALLWCGYIHGVWLALVDVARAIITSSVTMADGARSMVSMGRILNCALWRICVQPDVVWT